MAKRLTATIDKDTKQLLINDFGYEPVDLESYTGQIRALKESFNTLQIKDPKDPRLIQLQIAVKDLRADREIEKDTTGTLKKRRKRRKDSKSLEQIQAEIDAKDKAITDRKAKKKKDAMNFISPGSAPAALPPAEGDGGGDMSSVLTKIAGDVNIIKGIVASQESIEKEKLDDTREAREKKKRTMKENLLEGGKKMYDKVAGAFGKVLEPAKGIFESIFNFIKLFILGAGLMKILDWFGNPDNKSKITSIFRFLKDWWPAIVAALIPFLGGIPLVIAVVALAVGFLPKIIDTVKMLFGFGKQVDEEIAKNEKDLEKSGTDVKLEEKGAEDPPPPEAEEKLDTTGAGEKSNVPEPQQFNQGGEVPGQGNTDTVPAMLTPGEFVLTKEAVNQVGADTLYGMNAAAGGVGKPSQQPKAKPAKKKMKTSTVGTMMKMGGLKMGGMTNNMSYAGGGQVPVQNYFMGGLVKKVGGLIAKTPQARLIKFAVNQVRKAGVKPPAAKALKALKALGITPPPSPMPEGGDSSVNEIPRFSVVASGGRAKEQTLGIRR